MLRSEPWRYSSERSGLDSLAARFTTEDEFAAGDRAVVLWRYDWVSDDGSPGHVRGVDVFRVRDGKIAEKRSYVKG